MIDRFRFPILVALLIFLLELGLGPHPFDDAYITFRYARNLANGFGFVYNPDQPILGTTTPLYTLWLALFSSAISSSDYPWLALITNAVCDVTAILLLRRLVDSFYQPPAVSAMIAIGYLANPLRIGTALGGMETSMVILWLVAAAEAYVGRNQPLQAALFSALAVLTRPDAILLPILFAVYELLIKRRIPQKEGLIFLAVMGPWLVFAQAYFGSPLPNSILAKSQAYFLHPFQALATLLGFLATRSPFNGANWPLWTVGLSLGVVFWFYIVGARATVRVQPRALSLVAFPPLYVAGLSIGNPLLFLWYYPPLIFLLDVMCLTGVSEVLGRVQPALRNVFVSLCVIGLFGVQWLGLGPAARQWPDSLRQREVSYDRVAAMLRDTIEPGSTVALPEIGVLGYMFGQSIIIDTVGLVSPEAIPYLLRQPAPDQPANYAISNEVVAALQPDYVITLEVFARPTLLRSPDFLNAYELIGKLDVDYFESRGLLVFRRKTDK